MTGYNNLKSPLDHLLFHHFQCATHFTIYTDLCDDNPNSNSSLWGLTEFCTDMVLSFKSEILQICLSHVQNIIDQWTFFGFGWLF